MQWVHHFQNLEKVKSGLLKKFGMVLRNFISYSGDIQPPLKLMILISYHHRDKSKEFLVV